ncbi:SEC-C metal-binding domain-containing protein [Rhodococcus sp. (in: high G+C Gram-positive bacteria)]|uniref:SEC-C metal-binding domain-containing protein n=1 Tax=Rhodococcus sp. TaxID=1831 RepID=UPI00388ED541
MNEPSTDSVAAAVAILDERWPLTVDEMAAALSDRGFGDVCTLETALELGDAFDDPRIMHLSDGRFVTPRNLLEGRIWMHRLTAGEISADAIELFDVMVPVCLPSADPAMRVVMPGEEYFEARGLSGVAWARLGVLLFPEGFLSDTTLGDLIAVTCVGGQLVVDLYPDQNAGRGSLGEWLADRAARLSDPEDALYPDTDLFVALADDKELARDACLPLSEQLEGAGLVRDGFRLVRSGTVTSAPTGGYLVEVATDSFSRAFDLDTRSARGAMAFLALAGSLAVGSNSAATIDSHFAEPDDFAGLADPRVARVCVDEALGRLGFDPGVVAAAAEQVLRRGPRRTRASALWIAGRASQARGDVDEAEHRYQLALAETPDWEPALEDLATIAGVRGDAAGGLRLLERAAGGASHGMYPFLRRFEPVEHPELGRNDRCWCGSGRKYKVCHLGRSDASLSDRAVWLYAKASVVLDEPRWTGVRAELDVAAGTHAGESSVDRLVADVALFDAGAFDEFVDNWAALLPVDEGELAHRWRGASLDGFVIEATDPGEGLTVRNVRTGTVSDVRDRTVSAVLDGATVALRLLPVGSELHNYGGVHVVPEQRREFVLDILERPDPAPSDLIRALTSA